MTKKIFALLVIVCFLFTACIKNNNKCSYSNSQVTAPTAETDSLNRLLLDSGITATKNSAGFLYTINQPGNGVAISNLCNTVSVSYDGSIFNGKTFDSTRTGQLASFQLGQVIVGWQKGLPLISTGGNITLYIPPSLAYGSTAVTDNSGNVIIPANSYLIFHVYLADVQ